MSSLPLSCTILGGANGSGKSTIYSKLHLDGELVNAVWRVTPAVQ
jgi:predicted ABC-type ATPase